MEKQIFKDEVLRLTGIRTVADRECRCGTLTYRPHGSYGKDRDVAEVVYDLMIIAAYDQMKTGQAVYKGDFTAAEMAGKAGYLYQFVENVSEDWEHYSLVAIETKTFKCSFHPGQVFETIAEWEGVMNLAPKKQHRFACDGQPLPKDVKLKPYTRCHQPKPSNPYSAAYEANRINKKLEVLGELRRRLSNEGMKKALAVLCAAKQWENNQARYRMALEVMRRRLWKDYGTDQYAGTMSYTSRDFEPGPEIWKQVDTDYANMLRKLFCDMLNAAPAPKWISTKDYVQVKDKEKVVDKLQGKLYVTNVYARLDSTGEKLVWFANVVAAKGREWQFEVDRLEPWTEPEKAKKKSDVRGKKSAATTKLKAKAANPEPSTVNPEPTLAERLRAALLQQFKQAA